MDIDRHNTLFDEACLLQKGLVNLDGSREIKVGFFSKRKLRKSILLFKQVIDINADNWAAALLMGKSYQSLGENENALKAMMMAFEINPDSVPLLKEIGMTAGKMGRHDLVVKILSPSCNDVQNNAGLLINYGLSLLFLNRPNDASVQFKRAIQHEPENIMNEKLYKLAIRVSNNEIKCPENESELVNSI